MSDHLMQLPVLLFAGMMVFFATGLIYCSIADALGDRRE